MTQLSGSMRGARRTGLSEETFLPASVRGLPSLFSNLIGRFLGRFHGKLFARVLEEHADYAAWVLEEVRGRGPLAADELPPPDGAPRRIPGAWIGTVMR